MKNILLVDDDPYLTDDIKEFILFEGYGCDVVNSAAGFFENSFENLNKYSCIVLDLMMKRTDRIKDENDDLETGEILYGLIKEKKPNIPIIILSAKNKNELHIVLQQDTDEYVMKPLGTTASELIEKIQAHV